MRWGGDLYRHQEVVNKMLKSFQPRIYMCMKFSVMIENDKTKIIHINLISASTAKSLHSHIQLNEILFKMKWKIF